jgi:hypothetical protein
MEGQAARCDLNKPQGGGGGSAIMPTSLETTRQHAQSGSGRRLWTFRGSICHRIPYHFRSTGGYLRQSSYILVCKRTRTKPVLRATPATPIHHQTGVRVVRRTQDRPPFSFLTVELSRLGFVLAVRSQPLSSGCLGSDYK